MRGSENSAIRHRRFLLQATAVWLYAVVQAAAPAGAAAQSVQEASDIDRETGPANQDIVVTGQKVTEREITGGVLGGLAVIDTPFSIRVISRDYLDNTFARFLVDTVRTDPSVSSQSTNGTFSEAVSIRGFSAQNNIVVDGVFVASVDKPFPVDTVERIEVLKGPSTFLYGSVPGAGPGGMINFVTRRALQDSALSLSAEYNSTAHFKGVLDASTRLKRDEHDLGVRFIAAHEDGEQYLDGYDDKVTTLYLGLDYNFDDRFILAGTLYYQKRNASRYQDYFLVNDGVSIPKAPNVRNNFKPSWGVIDYDSKTAIVSAQWNINDDWSVKFTGAGVQTSQDAITPGEPNIIDEQGTFQLPFIFTSAADTRANTQDLRVNGELHTGPIKHVLSTGFNRSKNTFHSGIYGYGFVQEDFDAGFEIITGSIYNPMVRDAPLPPFVQTTRTTRKRRIDQTTSFYINDIISTADERAMLMIGGRRVTIEQTTYRLCFIIPLASFPTCSPSTSGPNAEYKKSAWVPSVGVLVKPMSQVSLYGSYAQHLEIGGTSPLNVANPGETIEPVKSTQLEAGVKAELSRAIVSIAVFRIKQDLQFVNPDTAIFGNFGSRVHKGVELSVEGQVSPGLVMSGGVTYLSAKLADTGDVQVDGNIVPGAPKWAASLFADYRIPAVEGLSVNATVQYSSSQFFDLSNERSIPSWTRVDVGSRYRTTIADVPVEFSAYVQNVFNRNYWATASAVGFTYLGLGQPRSVYLGARVRF